MPSLLKDVAMIGTKSNTNQIKFDEIHDFIGEMQKYR